MRFQFVGIILFFFCSSSIHVSKPFPLPPSPLSEFSAEWDEPKYLQCNTAGKTRYMSIKEKEVIYILNLLRTNPELFANSVVKQYPQYSRQLVLQSKPEYKSLLETLLKTSSGPMLDPDSLYYISAQCHAYTSGQTGYTGHDRQDEKCKVKKKFTAECCAYGKETPLSIVMTLLIDDGVPGSDHRKICLAPYKKIGVSIEPHSEYRVNAVLDFGP